MNFSKLGKVIQFSKIGITSFALGKINRQVGKNYLIQELSKMPGVPAKMGQILTMRNGDKNSEVHSPQPIPLEWVKHHIEKESPKLAQDLEWIDSTVLTASIGQVHRAQLKNGSIIAIKVRYPGIENEIEEQLDLMLIAFKNAPTPEFMQIDTDEYGAFLKDFFKEEMDYLHEASAQLLFKEKWAKDSRLIIPQVYLEYSTSSLLVQSFEESISLQESPPLTSKEQFHYSTIFRDFFLTNLLQYGLVHTDLHQKNWGIRKESQQLVIYDFGATLHLSIELVNTFKNLVALINGTPDEYLRNFETFGFDSIKLGTLKDSLKILCDILFEPIREEKSWNVNKWNLQERVNDLLGATKWNFRTSGPPWFLLFIRGLNGWIHALKELQPIISDHATTKLFVLVTENDIRKVSLEFPSYSVGDLDALMPDHVLETIHKSGINLTRIIQAAIHSKYAPQVLFESKSGNRYYKVWLG